MHTRVPRGCRIRQVPAKEFVAAIATEDDLQLRRGSARNGPDRHGGGIREWIVEMPGDIQEFAENADVEANACDGHVERLRNRGCTGPLGEPLLREIDAEVVLETAEPRRTLRDDR